MASTIPDSVNEWQGLRVQVLGLGVTGFSVADALSDLQCTIEVIAGEPDHERQDVLSVLGVETVVAPTPDDAVAALVAFQPDLVMVSPGFNPRHPAVVWTLANDIPLMGDIELAWRFQERAAKRPKWLCVTGTNGKTTTTQLATAMVNAAGLRATPCGNIGDPILDKLRDPEGFDVLVVELSSFQLHYLGEIEPWASVCLNVAPDHIDWHGSFEAYRAAKGKVYRNTKTVCLYDTSLTEPEALVRAADVRDGARAIGYDVSVPEVGQLGIVDDVVCDRAFTDDRESHAQELATLGDLAAAGLSSEHLTRDVLAASGLALSVGVTPAQIQKAIRGFHVDHHRIETVADVNGILWVDDSKATNAHAADASLEAFDHVVWIVGGLLKGVDITPLIIKHAPRLSGVVVIGTDRSGLVSAFAQHAPDVPLVEIDIPQTDQVMARAVAEASTLAQTGDVVLLAPAAASWDQFTGYVQRGQRFARAVTKLTQGA